MHGRSDELAARMREAAQRCKLSATEIARRMRAAGGTTNQSAVTHWLKGDRTPSADNLARFAEVVGAPLGEFYTEVADAVEQRVADVLLDVADLMLGAGRSGPAALDGALGQPAKLSEEKRRRLAEASPAIRAAILHQAGMEWDLLTEQQKRAIVEGLMRQVHARRTPEDASR